jgi:phosphatidylinositol/phosphatidylcholine transfer protein
MARRKSKKAAAAAAAERVSEDSGSGSGSSGEEGGDQATTLAPPPCVPRAFPGGLLGVGDLDLDEDQLDLMRQLRVLVTEECAELDLQREKEHQEEEEDSDSDSESDGKTEEKGPIREPLLGPVGQRYLRDDDTLRRYLVAREWKLPEAQKLLVASLEWLSENSIFVMARQPDVMASIRLEGETGKTYRMGHDLLGRPIIYMRDRNQNTKNYDDQVRFTHYGFQMAVESMSPEDRVRQWVIIVDFNGQSNSNRPPLKTCKEVLTILMDRFPERLGLMVMVDAGMMLNMVWRALSPLVPAETKAKVKFVNGSREKKWEALKEYVDQDVLEFDFGGNNDYVFDDKSYWAQSCTDHAALLAQYDEAAAALEKEKQEGASGGKGKSQKSKNKKGKSRQKKSAGKS